MRSESLTALVHPLLNCAPNKLVCNIVGGVISPLLANIYLHWFEKQHGRRDGPGTWANSKLVRYADDFVVLARYQSRQLVNWIERLLEGRFRLTINREKTRIVKMRQPGESLTFLGFTLRYDRDQHRSRPSLPQRDTFCESTGSSTGEDPGHDRTPAMLRAHPSVDPRDQPLDDELESVLPLRLSPFGVPPVELVCRLTVGNRVANWLTRCSGRLVAVSPEIGERNGHASTSDFASMGRSGKVVDSDAKPAVAGHYRLA